MNNNVGRKIFIDTSAFEAVWDSRDQYHADAEKLWRQLLADKIELVTTTYVLDETFTLLRKRQGIIAVDIFRQMLERQSAQLTIKRVTIVDEQNAWLWFMRDFNRLSFTDAVSFAMMTRLGITTVFTYDSHFEQASFLRYV